MELTPKPEGSAISRYRLLAELGRGGMADVYLAMTAGPGGFSKLLVIKQLRMGDDPTMVGMFLDEARLAARVSHPNIVQTFEVVHEAAQAFMVMEFLDGGSLSRVRRTVARVNERVPLGIELKVLLDSLQGLHHAHELKGYDGKALGVVHRDFTPQNVMLTFDGDVKIVDFGIAKAVDQQNQTSAGMFKGKLTYVPPEQLLAQPIDRRADIFSAGVMLFEAITGASPWNGLNNAAITHALASGRLPRLLEVAGAPPELAAICDQAMAVDPDDRYATAEEMRGALEDYVREHGLLVDRQQLGQYVGRVLAEARKRTHEIIDYQMRQQTSLPSADTLAQSLPTINGVTPPPVAKVKGRSVPALMNSDDLPDTGKDAVVPISAVAQAPSHSKTLVVALGSVVVLLLAVVGWLVTPRTTAPPPAPVVVAPSPTAVVAPVVVPPAARVDPVEPEAPVVPPAPGEPAVPHVMVRLHATPAIARVFVDGLELPGNPFEGEYLKDGMVHELRITAPGFVEHRRGVQFERDVNIDVTLARVPPPSKPGRPAPPLPTATVVTTPVSPTGPAPPPAEPKQDDVDYFPPSSAKKKQQAKRALDSNIEFN